MLKKLKLFTVLLLYVLSAHTAFPQTADTDSCSAYSGSVGFILKEHSLAFPSMDWFETVKIYNVENRTMVCSFNVKYEARQQLSQIVAISYEDWPCGEYVIVLKHGTRQKEVKLVKDEYFVMLMD